MSNDEKYSTLLNVFKFHIPMPPLPPFHTFHRQHKPKKEEIGKKKEEEEK